MRVAKFEIGQIVRHRRFPFRGVVYDVDPQYCNTEEWWNAIPQGIRPIREQPFYHLLAENAEGPYVAYVSEQNLLDDAINGPVEHPDIDAYFSGLDSGRYTPHHCRAN